MTTNADTEQTISLEELRESEQVDFLSDWMAAVKRSARWLMIKLALVSFVALIVYQLLVLATRWVIHGMNKGCDYLWSHFSLMFNWIDRFSPSDNEDERQEKLVTLRQQVEKLLVVPRDRFGIVDFLTTLTFVEIGFLVFVVILLTMGVKVSSGYFINSLKNIIRRMRGVDTRFYDQFAGEAMRPGSYFRKGMWPKSQVQILVPGTLYDNHQGFAVYLTVKSAGGESVGFLITPKHVVAGYNRLTLKGSTGVKIDYLPVYEVSSYDPDLVYMRLPRDLPSRLGLRTARLVPTNKKLGIQAECTGIDGISDGIVRKAQRVGQITFSGSTVKGMSGAGYYVSNIRKDGSDDPAASFIGIHQGISMHYNVGVSVDLIRADLKRIVSTVSTAEAVFGASPSGTDIPNMHPIIQEWQMENIMNMNPMECDWANVDIDYDEVFDFEREAVKVRSEPVRQIELDLPSRSQDGVRTVRIVNQHMAGTTGMVSLFPASLIGVVERIQRGNFMDRLADLETNVQAVDTNVRALANKIKEIQSKECMQLDSDKISDMIKLALEEAKPKPKFPCDKCDVRCLTEEKLERHMAQHETREIVRFPCDRCETVCRSEEALARHRTEAHLNREVERMRYPCHMCEITCTSEQRLNNHVLFNHTRVQGESALPEDTGDSGRVIGMNTKPFLGQPASTRRKRKNFSANLKQSGKKNPSQSMDVVLSRILESLNRIDQRLGSSAPGSAGPSSAITRN